MGTLENKNAYILGIDTGGTYTDSVILNSVSKEVVCSSKSLTTKDDLKIGISNSIKNLKFEHFSEVQLISLSTTLATNAIVENKGCKTGLILIGKDLDYPSPADNCYKIQGQVDIKGTIIENINEQEAISTAEKLHHEVEAIAISCYASVRNPQLELAVKNIVKEITHKPVFCAHELTGSLGFYERTVTSVLNASLVKIIDDFVHSTKCVMRDNNIQAPLMVVKGDGGLMHESLALEKPIETILSGPAASTIGSSYLTKVKNAFILDMGGTTSDIINVDDGSVKIHPEGAVVGGWLTKVRAASVCTYGLGGDSLIKYGLNRTLVIGPEKVEPLCVTSSICKNTIDELQLLQESGNPPVLYRNGKVFEDMVVSHVEKRIMDILTGGAYSKETIAKHLNMDVKIVDQYLNTLIRNFGVIKCSLTPTDILHAQGKYSEFDQSASMYAVKMCAALGNYHTDVFLDKVTDKVTELLYLFFLQSAAIFEENKVSFQEDKSAMYVINKAFVNEPGQFLQVDFKLNKPIIGAGAPAHAWLPEVSKKLGTTLILPEHAEVTSAIGAALGQVKESARATIRPAANEGEYILYMPDERLLFTDKEKAIRHATLKLTEKINASVDAAGGENIQIGTDINPVYIQPFNASQKQYIETTIDVFAVASPKILK